jgi:hypothetical protein
MRLQRFNHDWPSEGNLFGVRDTIAAGTAIVLDISDQLDKIHSGVHRCSAVLENYHTCGLLE